MYSDKNMERIVRREERSYSIKRLWEIKRAFQDVGLSKSGIKIDGRLYSIRVDYSNASKEVKQQFKRALLKYSIKRKLETTGKDFFQICCVLAVFGTLLGGLDYLLSKHETKMENKNSLPNVQKITDQKKSLTQDTSRGERTE